MNYWATRKPKKLMIIVSWLPDVPSIVSPSPVKRGGEMQKRRMPRLKKVVLDGKEIFGRNGRETFVSAIQVLGVEKVAEISPNIVSENFDNLKPSAREDSANVRKMGSYFVDVHYDFRRFCEHLKHWADVVGVSILFPNEEKSSFQESMAIVERDDSMDGIEEVKRVHSLNRGEKKKFFRYRNEFVFNPDDVACVYMGETKAYRDNPPEYHLYLQLNKNVGDRKGLVTIMSSRRLQDVETAFCEVADWVSSGNE